ncbi:MAG TPA: sulfotransferase family 2 domain-containing protein [Anaerolineales bacterium]
MSKAMTGSEGLKAVLIFLHLPKAAGSTLARIIERQYGQGNVLRLYESIRGEEVATLSPERKENLRALIGHFYFGAHIYVTRPATYITILRDPVQRIISHYYYVRREPSHYLYPAAQQLSLCEYVIHCGKAEPNNDQTRLLAGSEHALEDGTWSAEMLPAAKVNLRDHFSVVGLVEEFDRSLILFKRVLGWRSPFYIKQNVSRRHAGNGGIPEEAIRVIRTYNEMDIHLYAYARQLLDEQARLDGESLERELRLFRTMNAIFGRLNGIKAAAAGRLRA